MLVLISWQHRMVLTSRLIIASTEGSSSNSSVKIPAVVDLRVSCMSQNEEAVICRGASLLLRCNVGAREIRRKNRILSQSLSVQRCVFHVASARPTTELKVK